MTKTKVPAVGSASQHVNQRFAVDQPAVIPTWNPLDTTRKRSMADEGGAAGAVCEHELDQCWHQLHSRQKQEEVLGWHWWRRLLTNRAFLWTTSVAVMGFALGLKTSRYFDSHD